MIQKCVTLAGAFSSHQSPLLSNWVPTIPLHPQCCILLTSAYQLQIPVFAPLSSLCSSYPKHTSALPGRKPCIFPVHLLLVHLLPSPLSQPLSSKLRCLSEEGGQPSTREWELHKNINLCSSPTTCPLIQLFFLAFAPSFLAAPKFLPVQLQLLFRFHWNLLRFLNILRDVFFPNFLKGALKTQGTRSPISIPTPCHFHAGRNQVQQDFWRAKFHFSMHMQTDSERFNWLGTVKQKTHYQNYPALNTPPREHVSSANARPAEKRENSITQRTGYSTLTH